MPVIDGEFRKYSKEELQNRLESNLEDKFDSTVEPGDLVKKQLEAEAETLAEIQEEALQRVYYAGFLEDATGKELDKLVQLIGLSRQEATSSTGTAKFKRDTPPTTDYTIPERSTIQTRGGVPIVFITTEQSSLDYIDGWEENNLNKWSGDTAAFSVTTTSSLSGQYALQIPATDGSQILEKDGSYTVGTTFDFDIKPNSGSITEVLFGYQDSSNYHRATIDTGTGEIKLETIKESNVVSSNLTSTSIPTGSVFHAEVEWSLYGDNALKLYETRNKETVIDSVFLDRSVLWSDGNVGLASADATATADVDEFSVTATTVNIRSQDTGTETNIGPGNIEVMKSGIAGVEDVTNEVPTGDTLLNNTNLNTFKAGEDREQDEELRERAFSNTSIGGAGTRVAIGTKIDNTDGVESVKIFQNKEDTTQDGLPPHSYEAVVFGGTDADVAQALFDVSCIDSTDFGGAHGQKVTHDITSDIMAQEETMQWSRPYELALNITIDLIVSDTYIGDSKIRSLIANYVGGTDVDGSFVAGIDPGDELYEAVLKQEIVSPSETGVWEVDNLTIDSNGDGTDDTVTNPNGADVLEVADSEIAQVNARDGSITINTIQR